MDKIYVVLLYIDMITLNCVQAFQDWTQSVFGLDCFFWAKLLTKIAFITYTLNCVTYIVTRSVDMFTFLNILYILWAMSVFYRGMNFIENIEKDCEKNRETLNVQFFRLLGARILCIKVLIFFVILFTLFHNMPILLATASISAFFAHYFVSCTPLPPSESKVKTWLKKAKKKTQEALLPEPEPCPTASLVSEIYHVKTIRRES